MARVPPPLIIPLAFTIVLLTTVPVITLNLGANHDSHLCSTSVGSVEGLEAVVRFAGLTEGQEAMLGSQCLVGVRLPGWSHDVGEAYRGLKGADVPILVTSDSVLHTYHVLFDLILQETETRYFAEDVTVLSAAMVSSSLDRAARAADEIQPLALRNAAFFGVAARLMGSDVALPPELESLVEAELTLIRNHSAVAESPLFSSHPAPEAGLREDYSQYKPRGHYDRSETLRRYFQAMMWYGRMGFRAVEDWETRGAILLTDGWSHLAPSVGDRWWRLYNITSFFVGEADDLLPPDYLRAVRDVYGTLSPGAGEILDAGRLEQFREALRELRNPRIVSSFVEDKEEEEEVTKGLRFMGQRYIIDSHVLQLMVYKKVGWYRGEGEPFTLVRTGNGNIRGFPRGLDVAGALGSDLAQRFVEAEGDANYRGFDDQQAQARGLFENLTEEDWNRTLYLKWLRSLAGGVRPFEDSSLPHFMRSEAYGAKKIHTALASWAQLRHDTILYAKQSTTTITTSYRPPPPPPPEAYVEPVVELYVHLRALIQATHAGLSDFGVLGETAGQRLDWMGRLVGNLIRISEIELTGLSLGLEDRRFLTDIGEVFENLLGPEAEIKDTRIVADVHTDPNSGQVLEEGTGDLALLIITVRKTDGSWFALAGPILTYHEFKHPIAERLTDSEWRSLLQSNPPAPSPWIAQFMP